LFVGGVRERQIQQIEVDPGRAGGGAGAATDATTGQVERAQDVPSEVPFERGRRVDPRRTVFVGDATVAVAKRAALAASVATNATRKFVAPILEALFRRFLEKRGQLHLFPGGLGVRRVRGVEFGGLRGVAD